jgi:hypothetical protein
MAGETPANMSHQRNGWHVKVINEINISGGVSAAAKIFGVINGVSKYQQLNIVSWQL